jgi:hypothetical protein
MRVHVSFFRVMRYVVVQEDMRIGVIENKIEVEEKVS